jgi:heat-inducible transcriptional repressor
MIPVVQLTRRQAIILKAVVLAHQASGRPVGSRTLVDSGVIDASPSTVRSELGRLEELGLLEHPHTSAGRVPTDRGYRVYVDHLLDRDDLPVTAPIDQVSHEVANAPQVEQVLRETTRVLAETTRLLAVVTAPPRQGAVVRRVEVIQLTERRLVVVCVTETGDVTKHVVQTRSAIDPGLAKWAGEYLNETITGMALGQNTLRNRLNTPDLSAREQEMLALLAPAFTDLFEHGPEVHVGGSQALAHRIGANASQVLALLSMLDERRRLFEALSAMAPGTLHGRSGGVSVRIGAENDLPELRALSLVGAPYGLATRQLGVVGLIGPTSLDYPVAMAAVSTAADALSDVAHDLYEA